jgi:hypothetical protein
MALKRPSFARCTEGYIPPLHPYGLSRHEGVGYLLPGVLDDPAEGLARYTHPFRGRILVKTLRVTKADGLQFVHREDHFLQHP